MDSTKKYHNPSPEGKTNFLSKFFYCWVLPFMRYGYKHDLEVKDIYNVVDRDQSENLADDLERVWLEEVTNAQESKGKPSLQKAIFKVFFASHFTFGITAFIQSFLVSSLMPIILSQYIGYFGNYQETYTFGLLTLNRKQTGWTLGCAVVAISFLNIALIHYCWFSSNRIGMRIRIACCSLVYRKLLRISQSSLGQTAAGQLVNLLSNDVQRFDNAAFFVHFLWIVPVQFVVASVVMYQNVGLAAIAGMASVCVQALVVQGYLSKKQGTLRSKIAQKTDYRVKIMSEIVSGIQVIKMYAWEKPFEKVVELARRLEIKYVARTSYIKGFSLSLMVFTERFILYLILVVFVSLGNRLTSNVVFSMAQLINIIQLYMCRFFPYGLATYAEARVAVKRLEKFLVLEENEELLQKENKPTTNPGFIKIQEASASWIPNPVVHTLMNINLTLAPGTLCCIVGNVGSGKSSLLQLLLKELPTKTGKLQINGTVAYASQEPWLFVSSVRNNILFGKQFLTERYKEVIHVCALERDLELFPYADKTLVGERGVSLSGGQRARINLARAVYSEADIYLLDDPLSAVDTHVGKHLFEKCIKGYLRGKTRILATHQLQFLKDADLIVVVNNGQIEHLGTFEELSETALHMIKDEHIEKEEHPSATVNEDETQIKAIPRAIEKTEEKEGDEPQETEELIEKGALAGSIYYEYYRSGANTLVLLLLVVLFLLAQISSNACDLWVRHWTNQEEIRYADVLRESFASNHSIQDTVNSTMLPTSTTMPLEKAFTSNIMIEAEEDYFNLQKPYITMYTLFIIGCIIMTSSRAFLFYKICMNACRSLHNTMFSHVLKAPMRFFDTNPSGRILNRFSKDIGTIDEILPPSSLEASQIFLVMIGIISMVFIVTPWMVFPTAVLGSLFYYFRLVYLSTAQDVKRIEGVTRAPVFSHVTATLHGLSTIRSSNAQGMLACEFDVLQDQHTGCWFLFLACSQAFGFYLDVISTIFLALVTLQFLVFRNEPGISGDVGLVISSSLILTGMLQLGVRQTAEVASNMTSVERVLQYTKLEKEEELNPNANKVPDRNWPSAGKITFKNVYLRYAPQEPAVLKNLNVEIEPGEKVGIVGRTGAGKSTLIASIFRLAPIEGTIAIDDVDTSTIQLYHLRHSISIIPQEPVLFSASIRYNLDPFSNVSDEVIWKALADVDLKNAVTSLEQMVSEGGSNFSVGQRQLVCLARAIVRNTKILVMDEATANVDPQTDALIQKTIRQNFGQCTVLTIAHRLNTIMDSDKVMVMNAGELMEIAHPHELLQNPGGYFTKMVEQTGKTMEEQLRATAKKAYENSN